MGVATLRAAAPARISVRTISSVAYATDDSASEDRMASPVTLDRRSWWARCDGIGRPTSSCLRDPKVEPSDMPSFPIADGVS